MPRYREDSWKDKRGSKKKRKKKRKQITCECASYWFPHRYNSNPREYEKCFP